VARLSPFGASCDVQILIRGLRTWQYQLCYFCAPAMGSFSMVEKNSKNASHHFFANTCVFGQRHNLNRSLSFSKATFRSSTVCPGLISTLLPG